MLSHPSDPSSEEAAIATATSEMRPAAPNRRRHHVTVEEFFSRFDREFFREWFVEGPRLILTGRFTPRDAGFMIAAATPAILSALFLTVPGLLFHTPEHNQFFHFAKIIEGETPSALPVILGTISSICSFRFPLG
jgi:hypothetical protein